MSTLSKKFKNARVKQFDPLINIDKETIISGDSKHLCDIINSGDSKHLCDIINDTFCDSSVHQVTSCEKIKVSALNVTITPLTYNSDGIFFMMSEKQYLNKFIKNINVKLLKLITLDDDLKYGIDSLPKYFICVKDGMVFVITDDFEIINTVRNHEIHFDNYSCGEFQPLNTKFTDIDELIVVNQFINDKKIIETVCYDVINDDFTIYFEKNLRKFEEKV